MKFKFSIITVCRNAEDTIGLTIESVYRQTYPNIEHVIVDGASTDRTVSIIKGLSNSRIGPFISEKDEGIYYAMEKGIKLSSGDVIYFLNAGDVFVDDTVIADVAKVLCEKPVDIVFGNLVPYLLKEDDLYSHSFRPGKVLNQSSIRHRFDLLVRNIHHQTIFYKKSALEGASFFTLGFPGGTDWGLHAELLIRNKTKFVYTNRNIAKFALGGVSTSNFEKELQSTNEIQALIRRNFFSFNFDYFYYFLLKLLNFITKEIKNGFYSCLPTRFKWK